MTSTDDRTGPQPGSEATAVPSYAAVGIGAGPANLSLAALFRAAAPNEMALFDRQPGPAWHPRLLYPGVTMQTSWMKDLVTLVDPQHPLTFMNYLVTTGRLYNLLNAQFDTIPRLEYVRYLEWASERIPNLHWGAEVDRVSYGEDGFTVYGRDVPVARCQHVVLGVGTEAYVQPSLADLPAEQVCVPDDLGTRVDRMTERSEPIAVVGGGQTGAECVLELLSRGFTDIHWIGRRPWFQPMDDSPPANDFYRPAYQEFLQGLARSSRQRLVEGQTLTGDAITPATIRALYQANYGGLLALDRFPVTMFPGRNVTAGEAGPNGTVLLYASGAEGQERYEVRYAVLATGRRPGPIPFDQDLLDRIELDDVGELIVDSAYAVRWKSAGEHRIYALNRARLSHGIADANLTLLPIRSALVLNSMFERQLFEIHDDQLPVRWG
jgi:lysine N6-hydroxylase